MSATCGFVRQFVGCALALGTVGVVALIPAAPASAATGCRMGPGGSIKHVIIIQFDNVHLERDNPKVPSDIEQMPALENFVTHNGTLLSNDHTVLISHTADGIISTETGLYPDQNGSGVSNTYPYLDPQQGGTHNTSASSNSVPGTNASSLFKYWTDPTSADDPLYTLIHGAATSANPQGVNTPAPWVPFTRDGCNFAGIGSADMEFENDTSDVSNVFGADSPQFAFGNWSFNTAFDQFFDAGSNLGETDFEGLAIHCSKAESAGAGMCSPGNGGVTDALPDEPGGYTGYNALFGALSVDPVLTGHPDQPLPSNYTPTGDTPPPAGNWLAPPVYDVFAPNATNSGRHAAPDPGNVPAETVVPRQTFKPGVTQTTQILDETSNPGFPGFDGMEANNALGYTAAAQEAGVPVTYTYISDVHDDQYFQNHGNAFGPGEAGYESQLRAYNAAFAAFFHRLRRDNITKRNTVFLVTVDEGDHYDGGPPLNPGCNGYQTPCEYDTAEAGGAAYGTPGFVRNEGEIDTNLPALIQGTTGDSTTFGFDDDDAPAIIVPNQTSPSGPRPGANDPVVRNLEREISAAKEFNPIDGQDDPITVNMADETEESILHMVNADPSREPTFTLFADPSFYFEGHCTKIGSAQGLTPEPVTNEGPGCPAQDGGFAWNHGDVQPEIASTYQGWVGPGIRHLGETASIWTDHAGVRPTMMTLLGLKDDYSWDGAATAQILDRWGGLPWTISIDRGVFNRLASAYKQLDAPFGAFGMSTLNADTSALASNSPSDATYTGMDDQLQACENARAPIVAQMQSVLQAAETGQRPVDPFEARRLVNRADQLIQDASELANDPTPPASAICS